MGKLNTEHRSYLEQEFGPRVTFRETERKLYGHDIAAMPGLIKPMVGKTVPGAVVQPESEAELVDLARWGAEHDIPLTPRGKATSGYGGVLPVRGGVVVDFYRMNKVQHIDSEAMTATVQAGVVWEKLDRELMKQGLTLRLYPSSYPAATVGGWLAQGGAGIGSYEAGWFRDNVVSARVVMPGGEVREFSGTRLDLISDAEGTTGLISEVTLRVQVLEEMEVVAVG
ncbi:MAG: FAD-binding oxidoreductase, partial [Pseudomonadota bacterium]